jgi:Type II secretion system (T2SS), protein M subtype b
MTILPPTFAKSIEIALSAQQQRVLALLLALAPVLVLVWMFVVAMMDMLDYHAQLSVLKRDRAIYEDLIEGLPQRKLTIEEIGRSGAFDAFFVGLNAQDVGRQLDARLTQLLSANHAMVAEHNVTAPAAEGAVVAVTEHLVFTCDIEALTHILHQIGQAKPVLFVDHLAITDVAGEAREHGPHILNVDMLVSGYKRPFP